MLNGCQLYAVNFPSESSPLPLTGIKLTLLWYATVSNQRLYPRYPVFLRIHGPVDKGSYLKLIKLSIKSDVFFLFFVFRFASLRGHFAALYNTSYYV